jgi:hypothetical protein
MAAMLYGLHRFPWLMHVLRECLAAINTSQKVEESYIRHAEQSLQHMWSFVKEMSSRQENDYQYLYEREWRIVDGAVMHDVDVTRELSSEEYQEFATKCNRWTMPLSVGEHIMCKYPHRRMLQLFRIFNGLPGKTVSQAIDLVLVPSDAFKRRVLEYMNIYPERFCSPLPAVRVFGEAKTRGSHFRTRPNSS